MDNKKTMWRHDIADLQNRRLRGLPINPYMEPDHNQIARLRAQEIRDPLIKQVVEKYTKAPHYGPAHAGFKDDPYAANNTTLNVSDDVLINRLNSFNQQVRMSTQGLERFDNAEDALQHIPPHLRGQAFNAYQRSLGGKTVMGEQVGNRPYAMAQNGVQSQQQAPAPQGQASQQIQVQQVRILEGFPCFKALNVQGFYAKFPLVRAIGVTNAQLAMTEFVTRAITRAYVVPPNQNQVDMALIERNQNLLQELVIVEAGPMTGIGQILVPRQAIATAQRMVPQNQGHILRDAVSRQGTMINDGRFYNQQQNFPARPMLNNNPQYGPRKILKG